MGSVAIVSGPPASGKTTLCKALAGRREDGVHIESDVFYEFVARRVDPTTPESKHQNTVIMRALANSALAYADGGYTVYLDGVIGPWFLPEFRAVLEVEAVSHYVVLHASEGQARTRARQRQGRGLSPIVEAMQPKFMDLGPLAAHAVDTGARSPDEVLAEVSAGLDAGSFVLDWSKVQVQ